MNTRDWYTMFIAKLEQESSDPNTTSAVQELLDNQGRACFEAGFKEAQRDLGIEIKEKEVGEEQEKLFDAQVKWAFSRAVSYVQVKGIREDVAKTISSMMVRELERLPDCCVTSVRVNTDLSVIVSLTVEGINGGNRISKTIEISDYCFELSHPSLPPSNFNPPEKTTIDEDMMNFLIK